MTDQTTMADPRLTVAWSDIHPDIRLQIQRDTIIGLTQRAEKAEAAVAAARAQIVGWLRFQEREWRDTSANLGSSVAGNVAAHYAQALHNAIESIETGAPERWAAEREGSR